MPLDLRWPLVALGGAVGALTRWAVVGAVDSPSWPWPVVVVNVAGSLVLGWIVGRGVLRDPTVTVALGAGFCGGLTTMSTLTVEVAVLARSGRGAVAATTLLTTVAGGLAAAAAGLRAGRRSA